MMPALNSLVPLAAVATSDAARAVSQVHYRFGRLDDFDDPRLFWSAVAAASALLITFVVSFYRRESVALPPFGAAALAALRLTALAGALVFFLAPLKRTDQEIVTESRVVVLVDASQSMGVEDEEQGDRRLTRSEAALQAAGDSAFLATLRQQHDVVVAAFDSDFRQAGTWKRLVPSSADGDDEGDAETQPPATVGEQLKPRGVETRLGDALATVLGGRSAGPLAGVLLFSDGGQNRGVDPLAIAEALVEAKTPVAAIGVGSTDPRRNIRVQDLIAPARAYPGDPTTVRALVQGEGYAGRTVEVDLYARESGGAAVRLDRKQLSFESDNETRQAEFEVLPSAVGRLELEARLAAPDDDQYVDDNQRAADMEVVESSLKVLLVASGATRDYRFLRDQLRRDEHVAVDVLLQLSPPGISQDADNILPNFPSSKEQLFAYDAIVAFDPDWTQLDADQVQMLEEWVAQEAGGMIVVAGPVNTAAWVQSADHAKIRGLYPVEFQRRLTLLDDGLFGSTSPWPVAFTREGEEADFLWLGDTPNQSRSNWQRFPGVFGCFAVKGPKPGAQVYARYSDPEAGLSVERPVYFADHFYGAGRVFYMGSGELWRLRALDVGYFEKLYTQLLRHVSEGRLLRGSSVGRLLVDRDRYYVGDVVAVRAQLSTLRREPYMARSVTARVTAPPQRAGAQDGGGASSTRGAVRNVELLADANRPGSYLGQFVVASEGSYRIELTPPEAPDELLSKRITAAVPDLEFRETRRDEELLTALATKTGGHYYPTVEAALRGAGDVKPAAELFESLAETKVIHGKPDEKFAERVNQALLAVICGALCLEWLLRRLMKLA